MPHLPRLKLCETCEQLSFVHGASGDLRCNAPRKGGGFCQARGVKLIALARVNKERGDLKLRAELAEAQVAGTGADIGNLRAQHDELVEIVKDLRETVRDLTRRHEASEARAREAEKRAEAFRRELLRGGLRPGDLR